MGATLAVASFVYTAYSTTQSKNEARKQNEQASDLATEQRLATQDAIDKQKKQDEQNKEQKGIAASATQKSSIDAIRAAMSANSGAGGSILTGPQGAAPAPTQGKTLLGV